MFCPGFINGLLPVHGFGDAFLALVAEGWHIVSADAHPVRSCEANVADLQRTISEGYGYWPTPDTPARTGVKSLTTTDREAFLATQSAKIDALDIPLFCLTAATKLLEVPTIQMSDWLALSKHCANNDMQVTQAQASLELPMATSLVVLHGHHWDVSYPPFPRHLRIGSPNLDHPFPRQAAVMAIGQLCVELGLA